MPLRSDLGVGIITAFANMNKPRTFSKKFNPKNMWHNALQNGNAQCCTGYCSGGGMSVRIRNN